MKLTENRLITLNPGSYLSTGKSGPTHVELKKQTTGLIIESTEDKSIEAVLHTVLVGNKLINVWSYHKCT
jgi:hypothetical protein